MIREWFNIWLFLLIVVILLIFVVISMPFVAVHNMIQYLVENWRYLRQR